MEQDEDPWHVWKGPFHFPVSVFLLLFFSSYSNRRAEDYSVVTIINIIINIIITSRNSTKQLPCAECSQVLCSVKTWGSH